MSNDERMTKHECPMRAGGGGGHFLGVFMAISMCKCVITRVLVFFCPQMDRDTRPKGERNPKSGGGPSLVRKFHSYLENNANNPMEI